MLEENNGPCVPPSPSLLPGLMVTGVGGEIQFPMDWGFSMMEILWATWLCLSRIPLDKGRTLSS